MTLSRNHLILLLTGFSVSMILGAWVFQYVFGYPPCKLCYYQRYPHWAAAGFGILALLFGGVLLPYLAGLSAAVTGAIGIYHSGVERKLWDGPATCTSGNIGGLSTDELFDQIMSAPMIRCDEIPWEMFGLTMANLNALFSLGAALIWIFAARQKT
ncbi:disulfide bond formation protein B [Shimia sp.]|uniref:disulfide bond formation protein B n=1 Tax=Shimia sp. TaxID=1954381 RepID=UPI003296D583